MVTKTRKKPYTNVELFEIVLDELRHRHLLPGILDYECAASGEPVNLNSYHWETVGVVSFRGSEGIYLDVYARGNVTAENRGQEMIRLGTFKTLYEDKISFNVMSLLNTEFVYAADEFVRKNIDDFSWTGWTVTFYRDLSGCDEASCVTVFSTAEDAERTARINLKCREDFLEAVIVDNSTGKVIKQIGREEVIDD